MQAKFIGVAAAIQLAALSLMLITPASASTVVYTYQANPLVLQSGYCPTIAYVCDYNNDFTFAYALGASVTVQDGVILGGDFAGNPMAGAAITPTGEGGYDLAFNFDTAHTGISMEVGAGDDWLYVWAVGQYPYDLDLNSATYTAPPGHWVLSYSDLTPVPLPAALPLFATGVGALGLLGWRRKRRAKLAVYWMILPQQAAASRC
jgi:hypothetical protein